MVCVVCLADFVDDAVRAFTDLLKLVVAVHPDVLHGRSSRSHVRSANCSGSHDEKRQRRGQAEGRVSEGMGE